MKRSSLLWIAALLITLVSAVYQRLTGPTYPVKGRVMVGSETIRFMLLRSFESPGDAQVTVAAADQLISGTYEFRRQPSSDAWTRRPLERQGDLLVARLPNQPASGKVLYRIYIGKPGIAPVPLTAEPLVLRFKNHVPRIPILYPHIALMFIGILCSTRAGLEALARGTRMYQFALWAAIPIFVGGIILGPVVQKYAFDAFWTGWPVGHDLTDNKTAVALIFWLIAAWRLRRNRETRGWVILAAVVTLVVFAIPHSVFGSEIDYSRSAQ